jgi:predicted transcriptional regulator
MTIPQYPLIPYLRHIPEKIYQEIFDSCYQFDPDEEDDQHQQESHRETLEILVDMAKVANVHGAPNLTRCPVCQHEPDWESLTEHEADQEALRGCLGIVYRPKEGKIYAQCANLCAPEAIAKGLVDRAIAFDQEANRPYQEALAEKLEKESLLSNQLEGVGEQAWLVPELLGSDLLTILGGTSGDGKTFLSLYVALCVATGNRWFDRPVQQGRVLLVLLEGSKADRKARIAKLAAGMGVAFDEIENLYIYPHPLKADEPASLARLEEYATAIDVSLIVIDNLTHIRSSQVHGAESDSTVMSAVIEPLALLAHEKEIAILLLHHANAKGELRGSTAIKQHADTVFELERIGPGNEAPVTISRSKDRTGRTLEALQYQMKDFDDGKARRVVPTITSADFNRPWQGDSWDNTLPTSKKPQKKIKVGPKLSRLSRQIVGILEKKPKLNAANIAAELKKQKKGVRKATLLTELKQLEALDVLTCDKSNEKNHRFYLHPNADQDISSSDDQDQDLDLNSNERFG